MDGISWKENWTKTKERLTALWDHEIVDRACIAIPVYKGNAAYETITTMSAKLSQEELRKYYVDPETITREFRQKFNSTAYLGDALPCIFPYFGTCGFIQYTGSVPTYKPDTIWASEILPEPDASPIHFHEDVYKEHICIINELTRLAHDDYFIAMPDHCGILDGLAQLRGTENTLFDVIDNPEFLEEGVRKLIDIQKRAIPGFYDAIRKNNDNGVTHAWMHLWSPVPMMQIQCDFSVMLSPDDYRHFVAPELESSTEWCDRAVYHLDGQEQVRHLDCILGIDQIKMIQWTPVEGQPPTTNFIPVLQRIQKAGKGLVLILQPWEVEIVMDQLSSRGLRMIVNDVHTEEEANELISLVEKKTHD